MDTKRFDEIIKKRIDLCKAVLCNKAEEYATEDRLHNFKVAAELQKLPPVKIYEKQEITPKDILKTAKRDFTIRVEGDVFIVEAPWLAKILMKTDLNDYSSLQYFQNVLQTSGIIQSLVDRGITEGDTVSIYDLEFDYVP